MAVEQAPKRRFLRMGFAGLLGLVMALVYAVLPGGHADDEAAERSADADDEAERLQIFSVSPHDPYAGSTISIAHTPSALALHAFAGKTRLKVLARREGQIVAVVPRGLSPGDLKIRIATSEAKPFHERAAYSKPFHVRVRLPNYQKIFRNLLGGAALVVFGVLLLSRGIRESLGVHAARLFVRASKHGGFVWGMGALLGTLVQTTTGAAGLLAGLASSRVLAVAPAAAAFLGAPLGAAAAPLLVADLVEPREGLLAVAIGVAWLVLAQHRRARSIAKLLLGAGFVALGLQVFRPGLEPLMTDARLWSLAEQLRADSLPDLLLCAALGSLLVAALHGAAPLIVLMLGIAHATHQWDLRTFLALLSGTGLGAALAALITAPAGPESRALARLNLCLGAANTCLSLLTIDLWVWCSSLFFDASAPPLHWTERMPVSELGVRLSVGFGLGQAAITLSLLPLVPRVSRWISRARAHKARAAPGALEATLRQLLAQALREQQRALSSVAALALTGNRERGHEAEDALTTARRLLAEILAGTTRQPSSPRETPLGGAAFSVLQLQHALDFLLQQTEHMIDASIAGSLDATEGFVLPWDDETLLRSLHRLVWEGLEAARASLLSREPLDLDSARSREIRINRLEADARFVLLDAQRAPWLVERHLHVLQVVNAFEVSGNQIYRLAEILGQSVPIPSVVRV